MNAYIAIDDFEMSIRNSLTEGEISEYLNALVKSVSALQVEHTEEVMRGLMLEKAHAAMLSERNEALARLAITEEANSMLLARNKWLEHTLAVVGASKMIPAGWRWKVDDSGWQLENERPKTSHVGVVIEQVYSAGASPGET